MSSAAEPSAARLKVVAVIVSHDGSRWLPQLLTSLGASTRHPDLTIGVDTGSTDGSADLLRAELGAGAVVELDRTTGFGAAVAAGAEAAHDAGRPVAGRHAVPDDPAEEWLWLLHDDCAPARDALERLLETAVTDPRIAVVGCRVRAWPRARRLLEVGVSITGTGRRETGLEPGEYDQGQYDVMRDVLAVSSAGMLVRRTTWEALGGMDARLPLFRDDVDLGWRASASGHRVVVAPQAVVFHAEAASRGVREISNTARRPHQADRAAALFTLLANCRLAALPFLYLRLLLGSLLRAIGYLLGKLPSAAWDEVVAATSTLARPWRLVAARARRRRHRRGPRQSVRRLLPPVWAPYTHGLDTVLSRFSETARSAAASLAASTRRLRSGRGDPTALETGPVPEEAIALPAGEGPLSFTLRHPLLVLTGVLTLAGLVASRGLWGSGFLQGGALLPAPDGAADWWRFWLEGGHPVGVGSGIDPAPYVPLLVVPGVLLLGKAWLVVDLVMLFAPPLAGLGAWAASGRLVRGLAARVWVTLAYGLVPVVIGAVSSGHFGTVVFAIVVPWVVLGACRILDLSQPARWSSAWGAGLALSVATAFAPAGWPIAVGLGLAAVVVLLIRRAWARVAQLVLMLALPVGLLLPWSLRLLSNPALALREAGVVDVPGVALGDSAWQLAFFRIGAAGAAPWLLTAGVSVVALFALLRHDIWARVAAAWLVVVAGAVAAVVMGREVVSLPLAAGEAHPWIGVPGVVIAAGLVAAGGFAADGLASFVGAGSFGWRQPMAALGVLVGLSAPVLATGWWVGTAPHGELARQVAVPVPAYMVAAMSAGDARVLVLHASPTGAHVRYEVLAGDGLRLGDDSVLPPEGTPRLRTAIGDLLSQSDPSDLATLAGLGIGYVVVPSPQNPTTVGRLDAVPGLQRASTEQSVLSGWQLARPVASSRPVDPHAHLGRAVALGVAWLVVAVLAAPGIRRRPQVGPEDAS